MKFIFTAVGYEFDHVCFRVQSIPNYSISVMIKILKSMMPNELFNGWLEIKVK